MICCLAVWLCLSSVNTLSVNANNFLELINLVCLFIIFQVTLRLSVNIASATVAKYLRDEKIRITDLSLTLRLLINNCRNPLTSVKGGIATLIHYILVNADFVTSPVIVMIN